jgi:hypothetical protein
MDSAGAVFGLGVITGKSLMKIEGNERIKAKARPPHPPHVALRRAATSPPRMGARCCHCDFRKLHESASFTPLPLFVPHSFARRACCSPRGVRLVWGRGRGASPRVRGSCFPFPKLSISGMPATPVRLPNGSRFTQMEKPGVGIPGLARLQVVCRHSCGNGGSVVGGLEGGIFCGREGGAALGVATHGPQGAA